jgi:hypothetical protein
VTDAEEHEFLQNVARRYFPDDWEDTRCGESNPLGFPRRCSIIGRGLVSEGEEPAGSWHQQANGGVRYWTAVVGEIGPLTTVQSWLSCLASDNDY